MPFDNGGEFITGGVAGAFGGNVGEGDEVGFGVGRALSNVADLPESKPLSRWLALALEAIFTPPALIGGLFGDSVALVLLLERFLRGMLFSEMTISSMVLGAPTFFSADNFW